jgi:hypothetical protein
MICFKKKKRSWNRLLSRERERERESNKKPRELYCFNSEFQPRKFKPSSFLYVICPSAISNIIYIITAKYIIYVLFSENATYHILFHNADVAAPTTLGSILVFKRKKKFQEFVKTIMSAL